MAKTTTNPFTQTIKNPTLIILPSVSAQSIDSVGVVTNHVLFFTAGAEGSILKSLTISGNDTAAKSVSIWIQPGGTGDITLIGTVNIPITAGLGATGTIANVDVLANTYLAGLTADQSGRPVLPLEAGTKIYCGLVAALTASKVLYVNGVAEDF